MKTLLKNKRFIAIAAVALVAVIAVGSYAWFTASASAGTSTPLGRLDIDASVDNDVGDYYYQPGDYVNLDYTISNTHDNEGYLTAFVQANFADGTVSIRSDDNGDVLSWPQEYQIDPAILTSYDFGVKTVIDPDTYKIAAWYVDRTNGKYYAVIDDGMDAEANVEFKFDGRVMGNKYQGALFSFSGSFPATQMQEDAIMDVLGLDVNNLDPIDEDGNILPLGVGFRSSGGGNNRDYYMNLLYDRLGA